MSAMRIPTRIRVAAAVALAGLVLGGCTSAGADGVGAGTVGGGASPPGSSSDPVTAQRSHYVYQMLASSYAAGPETQAGFMSVIAGYGGGYVTSADLTGSGADEVLTVQVVLGAGTVREGMQGETDFGVAGVACFSYTLGYRAPEDQITQFSCPPYLNAAVARADAARQIGDERAAEHYNKPVNQIPMTLAAARELLFPTTKSPRNANPELTPADFATGTDDVLHRPMSALALLQQDGACEYVVFRWIRATHGGGRTSASAGSGSAGSASRSSASTHSASPTSAPSISEVAYARAWAAPTSAACTGAAALSAAAFLTADG